MKILAIDTSANACSVALLINDNIQSLHKVLPMQQAQLILPMIEELITSAKTALNQLDAIAFGCGPGSFTGVRIAASVAQGLAYASSVPLIKISSLAATAQSTFEDLGWKKILVGMDARINEVYWGIYEVNSQGLVELIGSEKVCPAKEINIPKNQDWNGAGSAWQVYRNDLLSTLPFTPTAIDETRLPMATGLLTLAIHKFKNNDFTPLHDALPVYLRDDVAKKSIKPQYNQEK